MAIARLEKPHCGKSGLPFMNSSTSLPSTRPWMRSCTSSVTCLLLDWRFGGELERVEHAAHAPAERRINRLVLAHARHSPEHGGDHPRCIVIAVSGEIGYLDAG